MFDLEILISKLKMIFKKYTKYHKNKIKAISNKNLPKSIFNYTNNKANNTLYNLTSGLNNAGTGFLDNLNSEGDFLLSIFE